MSAEEYKAKSRKDHSDALETEIGKFEPLYTPGTMYDLYLRGADPHVGDWFLRTQLESPEP